MSSPSQRRRRNDIRRVERVGPGDVDGERLRIRASDTLIIYIQIIFEKSPAIINLDVQMVAGADSQ